MSSKYAGVSVNVVYRRSSGLAKASVSFKSAIGGIIGLRDLFVEYSKYCVGLSLNKDFVFGVSGA
jgi:hypothetical protein